jgi:hypothetical protein
MINRLLIIDGNYFANRSLGIINKTNDILNTLDTDEQMLQFEQALSVHLISLWKTFSPFFNNFIFVSDSNSWRKNVAPYKPYYATDTTLIGYKEPRADIKEKSDTNYPNFYKVYNKFLATLSAPTIPHPHPLALKIDNLEGDDLIMYISFICKEASIENCIFSTDKDLIQLVNEYCFMFANTKSTKAPNGAFYLHPKTYEKYFSCSDPLSMLLNQSNDDKVSFQEITHLNLFDTEPITRSIDTGITIAQKNSLIVSKIICGDKADNILPLFRWAASTGTRNYSVTEKMIEKALLNTSFKSLDYSDILRCVFNDTTTDPNILISFLTSLKFICKQDHVPLVSIVTHFWHNTKLVVLHPSLHHEAYDTSAAATTVKNHISKLSQRLFPEDLESILRIQQIDDPMTNLLKSSI